MLEKQLLTAEAIEAETVVELPERRLLDVIQVGTSGNTAGQSCSSVNISTALADRHGGAFAIGQACLNVAASG